MSSELLDPAKIVIPDDLYVDEDHVLDVTIPKQYSQIPDCNHHVSQPTVEDIYGYFASVLNGDERIMDINGVSMDTGCGYLCDYCDAPIDSYFYRCYDCQKDMCHLCYGETSEEIAKVNGAVNYLKRKDTLVACRTHDLHSRLLPMAYSCQLFGQSSECQSELITSKQLYQNPHNKTSLCLSCGQSKLITDESFQLIDNPLPCYACGFGSVLDWVPVLIDPELDMILICLNPDSPYHTRYALRAMDNHGRTGYHMLEPSLTWDQLMDEYQQMKIQREKSGIATNTWEYVYRAPIKAMMKKRRMTIHYG